MKVTLWAKENLQKSLSYNTGHPEMYVTALSCKEETTCEFQQLASRCWNRQLFKEDGMLNSSKHTHSVLLSSNSKHLMLLEINISLEM